MLLAVMLVLAATLVLAAVLKLRAPAAFAASLVPLAGTRAARPLAVAVPLAELGLSGALLAGIAPRPVAVAVLALLAVFTWALARLRAADAPCNCFGARSSRAVSVGDLVRNGALAALAAVLAIAPAGGALWSFPAAEVAGAATVALGVWCAWQLAGALVLIPARPPARR